MVMTLRKLKNQLAKQIIIAMNHDKKSDDNRHDIGRTPNHLTKNGDAITPIISFGNHFITIISKYFSTIQSESYESLLKSFSCFYVNPSEEEYHFFKRGASRTESDRCLQFCFYACQDEIFLQNLMKKFLTVLYHNTQRNDEDEEEEDDDDEDHYETEDKMAHEQMDHISKKNENDEATVDNDLVEDEDIYFPTFSIDKIGDTSIIETFDTQMNQETDRHDGAAMNGQKVRKKKSQRLLAGMASLQANDHIITIDETSQLETNDGDGNGNRDGGRDGDVGGDGVGDGDVSNINAIRISKRERKNSRKFEENIETNIEVRRKSVKKGRKNSLSD
jgi:hypothetical protein